MAAESRGESPPITQPHLRGLLEDDPHSVGFFQAVRLLGKLFADRAPVGGFGDPSEELVRFTVPPSVAFPASEIQKLDLNDGELPEMAVNFMGLTGPLGVLPHHYTLLAAERLRARDPTLRAFLDLFHHRIISLFYRAWEKYRFGVTYERGEPDRFTGHLYDFIGLGLEGFRGRMVVPDEALVFYAGLLAPQQRSAVGLEQLLEDYFDVPVTVQQFVGGWYPLSRPSQCQLGEEGDRSSQVGLGAVVGDEVWDQQARVRVRLGPLSRAQYDQFLPTGSAYESLKTLTRFYSGDQYEFEVQLVLAQDEVPACVLGAEPGDEVPLGWCTWLRTQPMMRDPDETVFTL